MVEGEESLHHKDLADDVFDDIIQDDDGASDDEADSFKAASEQAYKQHLEEQSRRQSLRPQTAPTRPKTPSSADRKRRAVEQQNERFRIRPETPRVDYIPPPRPITGPEIDHAAWGAWLSPGCSYTQLMGPKSARPATAHAPRKAAEALEWRDGSGRLERGRQPWQDVKPCDVTGAAAKEAIHRQACGDEPQFGAAASPRAVPSPYVSTPQLWRRPQSASVADKRRRMQSRTSPSPPVRESPLRRRKESAGSRLGRSAESRATAASSQLSDRPEVPATSSLQAERPERIDVQEGAAERPASGVDYAALKDSAGANSGALRGSAQRNARFMAAIEERLNGMSLTKAERPKTDAHNAALTLSALPDPGSPASDSDTSKPEAPFLGAAKQLSLNTKDPIPQASYAEDFNPQVMKPANQDSKQVPYPALESHSAQSFTSQTLATQNSNPQPADVQHPQQARPTAKAAPRDDEPSVRSDTGAQPSAENGPQMLDVRIAPPTVSVPPKTETDSRTLCTFPARPFTAGAARPAPSALNPPNPLRPATAPVKPCIPSLSESFSRMGLGSLENGAGTGRADLYRNPMTGRSSARKAPSAYSRRVMAPPQFVQLTPWDAKLVEDVAEKVTEANRLSRALGLSVRYSIFQNAKSDVWMEVFEARTRAIHAAADDENARLGELPWRRSIEDPAEAAALSAVRNADAGDPADEYRGPKLRDISVDVFLRTHRRLQRAAADARFRGFLSLAEERNDRRRKLESEEKKELWEELGVNEGYAKILSKAREQVIQHKHSIASSGRDVAVRGRLIGATERPAVEAASPPPNKLLGYHGQSKTNANVAKALDTMSSFGLSMGKSQVLAGLFMTGSIQ